jgi:Tol biopolymer transport system component
MANRRYLNFDLLLEEEGEGRYRARVISSPLGDVPHVDFRLPFDADGLELLLRRLDPGRSGVRGGDPDPVQSRAVRDLGGPLFDAVFTGGVLGAWNRSLDRVRAENASGLRLRLHLDDAPAIAGLPWELLYDRKGRAFPAQSERTPLVRFIHVDEAPRPLGVDGPLRVLAVLCSPDGLERLDLDAEWGRIREALAEKVQERLVVVDRLPIPTVNALAKWLRKHDTHVIHFVGHGDFNPTSGEGGEGFVYFQDANGLKAPVTAAVLGPFIHDHDPLRMVVLNACRSARTSAADPYGGMAQGLVQQDATAVVAMQFPISDLAAVTFTGEFYGALADGLPVDQAVSSARKLLQVDFPEEWATPVLFLRSPDGNIFENVHAEPVAHLDVRPPGEAEQEETEADEAAPDEAAPDEAAPDEAGSDEGEPDGTGPDETEPVDPGSYRFLYERDTTQQPERSEPEHIQPEHTPPEHTPPEHTPPDHTPPDHAHPEGTDSGGGWIRRHARGLAATSLALVVLIAAIVLAIRLSGTSLPAKDALTDTQMLVAAGDDFQNLEVYLVDEANRGSVQQLTEVSDGDGKNWLPVLSPDRRSMIYVHDNREGIRELRVAAASDGSGDRPLFDTVPPMCGAGADRPAWIPDTEDLVLRCNDGDVLRLVRVDVGGDDPEVLLELGVGAPEGLQWVGDPTVSSDGDTVVFVGNQIDGGGTDKSGSLYRLDLADEDHDVAVLLGDGQTYRGQSFSAMSDAVFSHKTNWLAWRANTSTAGEPVDLEVYAAPFSDEELGGPVQISNGPAARDQDPMFSTDGQQIVYGSQHGGIQDLYIAPLGEPDNRFRLDVDGLPSFRAVPAWSLR